MRNPRIESATYEVFKGQAIPIGGTLTSMEFSLLGAESFVGLFVQLVGTGTVSFSYKLGIFSGYLASPPSLYSILTGHTSTGGPLADGKTYLSFIPPDARFLQLIATETGGAASPVLTLHMIIV